MSEVAPKARLKRCRNQWSKADGDGDRLRDEQRYEKHWTVAQSLRFAWARGHGTNESMRISEYLYVMTDLGKATVRSRVGKMASRIIPNLDERAWRKTRVELAAHWRRDGAGLSGVPRQSSLPMGGPVSSRPVHIVVVPMDGPTHESWKPAGGNFFYEIQQAAREFAPDAEISIFSVEPGEQPSSWHGRLAHYLIEMGATHLVAQVETDPERAGTWTWDVLWADLAEQWDGVLLGVMFDSAFRLITLQSRELARISDRFVLVDICMPMDGVLKKGRTEVGPVNMPISNETLAVIDECIHGLPKIHDVSFIGALYPYRVELLDQVRAHGANVAVNPHRVDVATDFESSRTAQPTYLDYMTGIAQSRMTINFSESSAGLVQQLKTRILEAACVGTLVLTDDVDRTSRFWDESEYGFFASPQELPSVVERLLADPVALDAAALRGRARARLINVSSFWGGIDSGLAARKLRGITTL